MKKKMPIIGGLLLAVVVTGYAVSGTYAKFTASETVTDTARVAKFGLSLKQPTEVSATLFSSVYGENVKTTEKESEAENAQTIHVVAPGTSGKYTFYLDSSAIETAYKLSATGTTVTNGVQLTTASDSVDYNPIKFAVYKGSKTLTASDWKDFNNNSLETELNTVLGDTIYGPGETNAFTETNPITIEWKWDYDDSTNSGINDVNDTKLATTLANSASAKKIEVNLKLTATQAQKPATPSEEA